MADTGAQLYDYKGLAAGGLQASGSQGTVAQLYDYKGLAAGPIFPAVASGTTPQRCLTGIGI